MTDMHVELPHGRPPRNLGLILLSHVNLDEPASAIRTGVGQLGFVAFADLIRRRRGPMAVRAVLFARFAAGRFRVRLGRSFAERSGLTLTSPPRLIALAQQLRHPARSSATSLRKATQPAQAGSHIPPS